MIRPEEMLDAGLEAELRWLLQLARRQPGGRMPAQYRDRYRRVCAELTRRAGIHRRGGEP